jgi:hypothetical protein
LATYRAQRVIYCKAATRRDRQSAQKLAIWHNQLLCVIKAVKLVIVDTCHPDKCRCGLVSNGSGPVGA